MRRWRSARQADCTTSRRAAGLPDALTGLLTATPFSYTMTAAPPLIPQGERMDEAAVRGRR